MCMHWRELSLFFILFYYSHSDDEFICSAFAYFVCVSVERMWWHCLSTLVSYGQFDDGIVSTKKRRFDEASSINSKACSTAVTPRAWKPTKSLRDPVDFIITCIEAINRYPDITFDFRHQTRYKKRYKLNAMRFLTGHVGTSEVIVIQHNAQNCQN